MILRRHDLERLIVAVLLSVEHAPAEAERPGEFRAKQAINCRITVSDVDAGDLVVPIVLEARGTQ